MSDCERDGWVHRWLLLRLEADIQERSAGADLPVGLEATVRCVHCRSELRGLSMARLRGFVARGEMSGASMAQWASLRPLLAVMGGEEWEHTTRP